MSTTTTVILREAGGGAEPTAVHDGVPDGVPPEQDELGRRMAPARLARLLGT